jgi:HD-GYP domain-containing protein (c-di-GMP phosphodiesterase class II)
MSPNSFANKLSRRHTALILFIGIAVSLIIGMLNLRQVPAFQRLDNALLDTYTRVAASQEPARSTVVIDIDDASLAAVGQWPWPRYRVAALIQGIAALEPQAIALDILFPETDRASLANIQHTFKRDFGVDLAFSGVPAGLLDNDGFLGQVIADAGVVGASYFYFDRSGGPGEPPRAGLSFDGRTDLLALHVATGAMANTASIAAQTSVSGFVNSQLDSDGVLRRLPLLISHGGNVHPSLALAAVMRSLDVATGTVEVYDNGLRLRIGRHQVPIDSNGYATLRFNGAPGLYAAVSAVDVLNGSFDPASVRGKIVFIGTSATGLNDHHHTAVDPRFPGLKIQAAMAENIVTARGIATPGWAAAWIFIVCIGVGAMMSAVFVFGNGISPFVAGSLLSSAAVMVVSVVLFVRDSLFVSAAAPLLVVSTLFVVFFATRFTFEKQRAQNRLRQLENARQVTIESMAAVAETRDPETGAHIKRTQNYVRAIAEALKKDGHYLDILTKEFIDLLYMSAPLHDIGKVGVPDDILLKPGRLTPQEMELMKQHAEFGRNIIFSTAQRIEGDNFLVIASDIAATHHEKWDGTGYPRGLSGQDIPLAGRIMAVADIYDALISRRCYKEPFPHSVATGMMRELRGITFDPVVLDTFFRIEDKIIDIAERFKDEPEHAESPALMAGRAIERMKDGAAREAAHSTVA